MSPSLSGVQLHHERQATEPCVQHHHVGVSLPGSGRPGVSVLPGVVRPDTLPSDRGMYSTSTWAANKEQCHHQTCACLIRFFRCGWFYLSFFDDIRPADSAAASFQAYWQADIVIFYSNKETKRAFCQVLLNCSFLACICDTSRGFVCNKINKAWQKVTFVTLFCSRRT